MDVLAFNVGHSYNPEEHLCACAAFVTQCLQVVQGGGGEGILAYAKVLLARKLLLHFCIRKACAEDATLFTSLAVPLLLMAIVQVFSNLL